MRIGSGTGGDVSFLQSVDGALRNQDTVTAAGNAFIGKVSRPSGSGLYATVQLWNPDGSGVLALIDKILITFTTAQLGNFDRHDTALATLETAPVNNDTTGPATNIQVRSSAPGTKVTTSDPCFATMAYESLLLTYEYPVILRADEGYIFYPKTTDISIKATFFYRELTP